MAQMGRPRIEIDKKDFESLLAIQCTLDDIVAFFENKLGKCSADTIERWCKREYGETFAVVSAKKRAIGRISLRRAGFQMAQKNAAVHIFYAKNYLGMRDTLEAEFNPESLKKARELLGEIESVID